MIVPNVKVARSTLGIERARSGSLPAPAVLLISVALLGTAWYLSASIPRQSHEEFTETGSAMLGLLRHGLLPWLLQFAAIAILIASFAVRRFGAPRRVVAPALAIPLTAGLIWWTGLALLFRGTTPMEAVSEAALLHIAFAFGGGPAVAWGIFFLLGPIVCPLALRGPSMQGFGFTTAGLSSAVVIVFWLLLMSWIYRRFPGGKIRTLREGLHLQSLMQLYLAPAYFVAGLNLTRALRRVYNAGGDEGMPAGLTLATVLLITMFGGMFVIGLVMALRAILETRSTAASS